MSGKEPACECRRHRDVGSIPGLGDVGSLPGLGDVGSLPGEGNGNPLQYSCGENPMDRGPWWATVYGVTKSQTRLKQLSTHRCLFCLAECIILPSPSHLSAFSSYFSPLSLPACSLTQDQFCLSSQFKSEPHHMKLLCAVFLFKFIKHR